MRTFFTFAILMLLFASLPSCYDEGATFGENLVDSSFRNVTADTSSVTVTNVRIDSLETSGTETILVGEYSHTLWGTVASMSYIPYSRPSYSTDIEETVKLDSLVLKLYYNGYYLGDTTQWQTLSVYPLNEKVVLNDNDYLYSHSSFSYGKNALGKKTFKPHPGRGEPVEIRLSDQLGQELLTRFHNRDESVSDDMFEEYFKGIALVAESGSKNLLGFSVGDTLSALTLYYHVDDELRSPQSMVISPNTSTQFNHFNHNRSGSLLPDPASPKEEITSAQVGDRGLLAGGLGWYTRLEFPYLNNILQQGVQVEIQNAMLRIYPEIGTYSEFNALPDSIYLYIADENNVVTEAVTDYLGTQVQGGVLVKDETFRENTYYYFDVTSFMQKELGTFGMNKHNLQLVLPSSHYTSSFKNLTFSSQKGKNPLKLQLTYTIYESY
ncbi:hypothetical protein SDC9_48232 [bioreactor metagenome]|uniref:DUF4270 domain-containing protein n=1 Tax=bioreactor metagenome TaxID=1076179 RepID=A0A644WEH2_9ZZZZ